MDPMAFFNLCRNTSSRVDPDAAGMSATLLCSFAGVFSLASVMGTETTGVVAIVASDLSG